METAITRWLHSILDIFHDRLMVRKSLGSAQQGLSVDFCNLYVNIQGQRCSVMHECYLVLSSGSKFDV